VRRDSDQVTSINAIKRPAPAFVDTDLTCPDETHEAGIWEIPARFSFEISEYFLPGFLFRHQAVFNLGHNAFPDNYVP
jgi:hypothetical protein